MGDADDVIAIGDRLRAKTKKPASSVAVPEEADHYRLAVAYVDALEATSGARPVYTLGRLWRFAGGLWAPLTLDAVAAQIGAKFGGLKFCRRGGEFLAIAKLAAAILEDERFFEAVPPGVAGPADFWTVAPDGGIVREPLTAAHRQRMRLPADPDFESEAPLFEKLLDDAFGTDEAGRAQHQLLKILFGGALIRALWRHRVAVLLLGKTTSGKSTLLSILKGLFPADQVTATSPQRWDSEYYLASLAGSALNIVGELDAGNPIPGGAFKQVVGCDVVQGRHPTHRPFSFVAQTAHFFNANRLPPTVDRSDAFFRRWRILRFAQTVADDDIILDLDERILRDELPQVVAWCLDGAGYLARFGSIPETLEHRRQLEAWRAANNSALRFLLDRDACELDPAAETAGHVLYAAYLHWMDANGGKPFGRNNFYEALDEGAGRLGVRRLDGRGGVVIRGVGLLS